MAKNLEPDHAEFLQRRLKAWAAEQPKAEQLRKRLLVEGGLEVVAPPNNLESDIDALLKHGKLIQASLLYQPMRKNSCHSNAVALFSEAQKPSFGVGTGWALRDDLWRQHSWGMDGQAIVETTAEQEAYFGILLYEEAAKSFCERLIAD